MRTILLSNADRLVTIPEPEPGSWVHIVDPDAADMALLRKLGIPDGLLAHLTDLDERPRVHPQRDVPLLVVNYPFRQGATEPVPFITSPLSVLVTASSIVTVSPRRAEFVEAIQDGAVEGLSTADHAGFILQLLSRLADAYLAAVRDVNAAVDTLEDGLGRSLRNEEVLGLLSYQKCLTHFSTSMRANELVLSRLPKLSMLQWSDADIALLEEVVVETRQAIDMVDISDNILSQMMDAFASIVSNNLNSVMKVLTSVTIVLAIPTLVASLYGMNVLLPGARSRFAFTGLVLLCVILCGALVVLFRRRNWL